VSIHDRAGYRRSDVDHSAPTVGSRAKCGKRLSEPRDCGVRLRHLAGRFLVLARELDARLVVVLGFRVLVLCLRLGHFTPGDGSEFDQPPLAFERRLSQIKLVLGLDHRRPVLALPYARELLLSQL